MSELWHGSRFIELNYFWDPDKTFLLPHKCDYCLAILSTSEVESALPAYSPHVICSISCLSCKQLNKFIPQYVCGDPRNQAIMIHEDGWASNSTSSKHSMAAITVTYACMTKVNRCNSEHAIVYSFVPTDQLPSDSPHKMDAFLQPLLEELEDLYIEGMEVIFCSGMDGISPPNDITTLRVLPLFKAHAEIRLTAAGG